MTNRIARLIVGKHAQRHALEAACGVGRKERGLEVLAELGEFAVAHPVEAFGDRAGALDLQVNGPEVIGEFLAGLGGGLCATAPPRIGNCEGRSRTLPIWVQLTRSLECQIGMLGK